MKISHLLFLLCFLNGTCLFAQNHPYDWEPDRQALTISEDLKEDALVLLKTHFQYEYKYENKQLVLYYTEHKIKYTGNDEAVEKSNKIYIPSRDGTDIVALKARAIKANGESILFDKKNIKEVKDDEVGGGYKIFAIEGAEVGGEIEYFYTKRRPAQYFIRRVFQQEEPSRNMSFRLITPENLEFDTKGYNGWPETIQVDDSEEENVYESQLDDLPRLREEDFGNWNNNRARLESKLSYNSVAGSHRLFSWSSAAFRMDEIFFPFEKDEMKLLSKELAKLKLKSKSTSEKILLIEDFVKSNYFVRDQVPQNASKVDFVVSNKFSSEQGITRFMIGLLVQANVPYELAVTSDRSGIPFDPDFDSWNYLNEYLLYFPTIGKYLSPTSPEFRLGSIPSELTATYALFVSYERIQGKDIPIADIKYIPAPTAKVNHDNLKIDISFNEDNLSNRVICDRSFKGYSAAFLKPGYQQMDADERINMLEGIMKYQASDAKFEKCDVGKTSFELKDWDEPFYISSEFVTESYIENAGDIILFKLGESIGAQSEMYQETERVGQVENDFNRYYYRTIVVNLPKGFNAQNLDDINMDVSAKNDEGKIVYLFKSSYVKEGQKITVTIDEFYDQIYFPLEEFEPFRAVVNAAADWNKITLVLEQE